MLLINCLERLDAFFGPDNALNCPNGLGWSFLPEFRAALSSFRHVAILGASRKFAVLWSKYWRCMPEKKGPIYFDVFAAFFRMCGARLPAWPGSGAGSTEAGLRGRLGQDPPILGGAGEGGSGVNSKMVGLA
ncbi:hypothetical protein PG997_011850 [Apiospora hydei]|uniref:Uncharacterized protein n=1 Tax=Apiospora hydei TaxID=1337664 RepID=A0ABR1V526_9PEZI